MNLHKIAEKLETSDANWLRTIKKRDLEENWGEMCAIFSFCNVLAN